MLFTVNVTDAHIEEGEVGDGNYCPIALALLGMGLGRVEVDGAYARFYVGHKYYSMALPDNAQSFISWFDDGQDAEPFCFEAEAMFVNGVTP